MIASVSGIRGILNRTLELSFVTLLTARFATISPSSEFLVGRDTRKTGEIIQRAVVGGLLSKGARVYDYGVVTTPALFRESRLRKTPAVMITASHNEPEWNGLKFIQNGYGIGEDQFKALMEYKDEESSSYARGILIRRQRTSYVNDLVSRFGEGSCEGVRVALDFGGGAAIYLAPEILKKLGCEVVTVAGSPGIFSRKVDPASDPLVSLQKIVRAKECHIGLAFDCDGDRLVIIDNRGNKRSGDYMLTLALSRIVPAISNRKVVVSVDTTQAVDELIGKLGGEVFRSKVGEANVVKEMADRGATVGGEGSSGGLIDGSFNYCRDSMLAALIILTALKQSGTAIYRSVKEYKQARVALEIPRKKAIRMVAKLTKEYPNSEKIDGVKIRLSRKSWVLIRMSGTEDVIRVSAEAETTKEAKIVANRFLIKLKELAR